MVHYDTWLRAVSCKKGTSVLLDLLIKKGGETYSLQEVKTGLQEVKTGLQEVKTGLQVNFKSLLVQPGCLW